MSQGFLSRFDFSANGIRRLLNWYPPFRGAGIRVREIEARAATEGGEKHEPKFVVEIVDGDGVTVADVEKTLYIRRKRTDGA